MSEDPFFVVKDEVFKALNKTRGLFLRWRELPQGNNDSDWTTTELKNSLRSIEWDLEDLEDTINIVEKNPNKFRIDTRELFSRRHFIDTTRDEVRCMKEKVSLNRQKDEDITARQPLIDNLDDSTVIISANSGISVVGSVANTIGTMAASRHSGTKYSKLENSLDSPSHKYVADSVFVQQRLIQGQDEQLDIINDSIGTLKTVSRQINIELDEQAVMLDDFGNDLDNTESKLDSTMKKVAKVLRMNNDKRQWAAIFTLSVLLLIVIILFIIL